MKLGILILVVIIILVSVLFIIKQTSGLKKTPFRSARQQRGPRFNFRAKSPKSFKSVDPDEQQWNMDPEPYIPKNTCENLCYGECKFGGNCSGCMKECKSVYK